jgi:hypothetical protein
MMQSILYFLDRRQATSDNLADVRAIALLVSIRLDFSELTPSLSLNGFEIL